MVYYEQIDDPVRLLSVMAGLELVLLLSTNKEEAFSTRREWQKLGRWMDEGGMHFLVSRHSSRTIAERNLC